jgi:hypothetical protein
MTTIQVLMEAADLIEQPGCWAQGALARDKDGYYTSPRSRDAVAWCWLGALYKVTSNEAVYHDAMRASLKFVTDVCEWNDQPGRTASEVAAAMRQVAKSIDRSLAARDVYRIEFP